jgi:predicted Zn-ribbon and HTH transcriptional regulator
MSNTIAHVDSSRPHPCLQCSYELGGSRLDSKCPECGKPVIESLAPADIPVTATDEKIERSHPCPCFRCSYDLRGLPMNGKCPECGTPVVESMRGILLHFADKEFVGRLHSGVSMVLYAILGVVLLTVANFGATAALMTMAPGALQTVTLLINFAFFGIAIMSCVGYYRFTTPDPGFTGTDHPDTARRVIRAVVGFQIGISALQFIAGLLPSAIQSGVLAFDGLAALIIAISIAVAIGSLVAFVVQFIAVMNYLAWLAKRIPDANIESRSLRYRWLLPVIYVVGMIAIIGPLIALVMYWNLLDRFRKHTGSIIKNGVPAALPGTHLG